MIIDIKELKEIAEIEFSDIVEDVVLPDINELRIILIDGSIYRHDNAPHKDWENVKTFPKHFHDGDEDRVRESYISEEPREAIRDFLNFVKKNFD